jgi:3-hydroxyacyl-CoA dehydrogenase/enoyl-CoA hydratase/3-hydroxybutyryl-CoA epimerase
MAAFQTESLTVEVSDAGIAQLWLDVPGRTHNVLSRKILTELDQAVDWVTGNKSVKLLVIVSRKQAGFLAGANLDDFTSVKGPVEATAVSAAGQRLFDKLADLRLPTVAVIHGVCLGGGLELALACDYRVVIDHPGTQLGLPEIKLGLLPGWGGTQRLPRVIGIERAIQVILQSRQLSAAESLRWGLADWLAPSQESALAYAATTLADLAQKKGKRPKKGFPARTWRQRLLESTPPARWLLLRGAERIVRRRLPDDMPAPLEALGALRTGVFRGIAAGLAFEREAIGRLATTTACRNLVTLFFLMEKARKPGEGDTEEAWRVKKVGVVGAGTMGAGIAQLAAIKGFQVVVQEVSKAALAAGVKKIEALFEKAAARQVLTVEEARRHMAGIGKTTTWEGFADADLVIEAVIEDLEKKGDVFRALEERTDAQAILATNTSSLSVRDLQQGLRHPERVGGLHFFNPVHKMPLVEVIQAPGTTAAIAARLAHFAAALGKTPVVVRDGPGFVVNRVLMPYLNEAGILVAEGMPIEQIDGIMRRFGMPMGPLELLDQIGLDVAAHVAQAVAPAFATRFTPHPALEELCQMGFLGQKSGAGFYHYAGRKRRVNSQALSLLEKNSHGGGLPSRALDPREALDRMVLPMVNEAAACLAGELAASADVIDLAMILGTGWAPHRGGPLRYADDRGIKDVVRGMEFLAERIGPRFEPGSELRRRAASGEQFYQFLTTESLTGKG